MNHDKFKTMIVEQCTYCNLGDKKAIGKRQVLEIKPNIVENSFIFFLGKQPGQEEFYTRRIFSGSTSILRDVLKHYKIDHICSLANVVRCYPAQLNHKTIARKCQEIHLDKDLEKANPKVIIALGPDVTRFLTDVNADYIFDIVTYKNYPVITFTNPAAWYKSSNTEQIVDFETLLELLIFAYKRNPTLFNDASKLEVYLRKNFIKLKTKKILKVNHLPDSLYKEFDFDMRIPKVKNQEVLTLFKLRPGVDIYMPQLHPWISQLATEVKMDIVDEDEFMEKYLDSLRDKAVAFDFETNSLETESEDFRIVAVGVYFDDKAVCVQSTSFDKTKQLVEAILHDARTIISHNASFEIKVIYNHLKLKDCFMGKFFDTMPNWHLIFESTYRNSYSLDNILSSLGVPSYDIELAEKQIFSKKLALYNMCDVFFTYKLYEYMQPILKGLNLESFSIMLVNKIPFLLAEIETNGLRVDTVGLQAYRRKLEKNIEKIVQKINMLPDVLAWKEWKREKLKKANKRIKEKDLILNPGSTKQLGEVFFKIVGIKPIKYGKVQPSLDTEVLEQIKHPLAKLVLKYRKYLKICSTYIDPFIQNPIVKASFHQTGTTSGRFSSSDPNIQNIPPEMKPYFLPREGKVFVEIDVAKAEAWMFAIVSKDPGALKAISERDFHRWIASMVFGKKEEDITSTERSIAKTATFSILYGCTVQGLISALLSKAGLKLTERKAQKIMDSYKNQVPVINKMKRKFIGFVETNHYIDTIFGRRRRYAVLKYAKDRKYSYPLLITCLNHPVQSALSDTFQLFNVIFLELIWPYRDRIKIVNTVHDSLLIEVSEEDIPLLEKKMLEALEIQEEQLKVLGISFPVPMKLEMSVGKTWKDLVEYKTLSAPRTKLQHMDSKASIIKFEHIRKVKGGTA